jgi:hypothetical protein
MKKMIGCLVMLAVGSAAFGQQKPPELTGTVGFNVGSNSGRVENIAVQVGDGGSGNYKAILAGDSGLPTHAIYRPRDLGPFGGKNLLPVVAFGNGGCRNSSGEFRNLLSDIASHGYVVVAIGPAGDAVVGGSEMKTGITQASQLLDGVNWIEKENARSGSEYYGKIDATKVAVMGQSCGTAQAQQVSGDPRVATSVLLNGGGRMGAPRSAAPAANAPAPPANAPAPAAGRGAPGAAGQAPGAYGNVGAPGAGPAGAAPVNRYAPYEPREDMAAAMARMGAAGGGAGEGRPPVTFHGSVLYLPGGPFDMAFNGAVAGYEALEGVPAALAYQDVGHYPATYRQPHGGAYAAAVEAWLDWQLKGIQTAKQSFLGDPCGLCRDPKWTIKTKNLK